MKALRICFCTGDRGRREATDPAVISIWLKNAVRRGRLKTDPFDEEDCEPLKAYLVEIWQGHFYCHKCKSSVLYLVIKDYGE